MRDHTEVKNVTAPLVSRVRPDDDTDDTPGDGRVAGRADGVSILEEVDRR
jgi:hypothetical protein